MKTVSTPITDAKYALPIYEKDWEWANKVTKACDDDKRPGLNYHDNRPIINLKQMLESSVEAYGDNVAFHTKFQKGDYTQVTYKETMADVNGLGTALIARGFKGKRIAVIGETTYMWSIGYLATVGGTGVVVPLDKELPYHDLKNLVMEANVSAVIFDKKREESFVQMMKDGDTPLELLIAQERYEDVEATADSPAIVCERTLIAEGKALVEAGNTEYLNAEINSEEMAIIIFTSGTTGMAKGIMLSHRNICADLIVSPVLVQVKQSDIFFSVLPIHHTYECTCDFLMPLYKGASIAHCEGLKYIVKNIQEIHPTMLLAVPAIIEALHKAIWKGIRQKGKEKLVKTMMKVSNGLRKVGINITDKVFGEIKNTLGGNLRLIICGGAAINPQILENIKSFGIMALQGYGLSECAPMGALNPDTKAKSHSIGIPFSGCGLKIADAGSDGIGEICLSGENIMLGYYNNPEATAEVLKDGWFYTGDLGYIDEDGYAVITGRKKNVIITKNGKNVFPEELEYQIQVADVQDVVTESMVFEGEQENKDDTYIVASIYPNWTTVQEMLGENCTNEEVEKLLWSVVDKVNAENPGYKMIKKILVRHTELEKNTSKKIKRFVASNKQAN